MIPEGVDDPTPRDAIRQRMAEAEDLLGAIRHGEIDALVVEGAGGTRVYTLHSADEPYRTLVEQMQEGAAVLTTGGDILYANARFAALVGVPLESLLGSPIHPFIVADSVGEFDALLAAGCGHQLGRLRAGDGGTLDVRLSLSTTPSPGGEHLNLVVTDLTDLLEAQGHRARAEQDNRTKDEFMAMLAHELRTPLAAISAGVAALEMQDARSDSANGPHAVVTRQVAHMSRLVSDLLDVERIVSGKLRLDRRPLDMADAVGRTVAAFTADDRFQWVLDITATPAWVEVDAVRIEQVLANLLTNAVKYTPAGGRITVTLRAEGANVMLMVADTGLGISPRLLPYVFDRYMQADRTIDRAEGGLGIGLTLVRRLVELHGGTIHASSEGDGKGSAFSVRLNRIPPVPNVVSGTPSLDRRAVPRRVLLIEDSADAREMLRTVLELAGHEVYDAPDGIRGMELLDTVRPDVGIIDINLPIMDGYEIAERIRREPHGRGMLLLALSGQDAPLKTGPAVMRGFDRHIVKPVNLEFLARLLEDDQAAS